MPCTAHSSGRNERPARAAASDPAVGSRGLTCQAEGHHRHPPGAGQLERDRGRLGAGTRGPRVVEEQDVPPASRAAARNRPGPDPGPAPARGRRRPDRPRAGPGMALPGLAADGRRAGRGRWAPRRRGWARPSARVSRCSARDRARRRAASRAAPGGPRPGPGHRTCRATMPARSRSRRPSRRPEPRCQRAFPPRSTSAARTGSSAGSRAGPGPGTPRSSRARRAAARAARAPAARPPTGGDPTSGRDGPGGSGRARGSGLHAARCCGSDAPASPARRIKVDVRLPTLRRRCAIERPAGGAGRGGRRSGGRVRLAASQEDDLAVDVPGLAALVCLRRLGQRELGVDGRGELPFLSQSGGLGQRMESLRPAGDPGPVLGRGEVRDRDHAAR